MKAFTKTTNDTDQKEETDAIAWIIDQVETIFDAQQSALQLSVDKIETTVATKMNQHKYIAKGTVDKIRKVKIDYLNLFEKEKQSVDRHIKKTYDDSKNNKAQFDTDTTLIITGKIDEIDMATITIKKEIETAVKYHLMSENMKDIISSNTLESFTTICNSKSAEIVDRIRTTAKAILKDNIWLKTHFENIAAKTTAFENQNIQEMVSQTVHSYTTQRIIDGYSKTSCFRHTAAATKEFAEVISEEDESEKEKWNRITEVVQNHQFAKAAKMAAEATTEENKTELDEKAAKEKAKIQKKEGYLIIRSLNKFEQKDIANIPKTKALSKTQAINIYKEI